LRWGTTPCATTAAATTLSSVELLRRVIVLLHIIGFAVTFGALIAEAASHRFRFTRSMDYGLLLSLLTGVILAAPWPAGIALNYPKLGVKLAILVVLGGVLGMGSARQRKSGDAVARPMFGVAALLSLTAAGIAVIW
jgi:hypothetical protein